MGKKNNFNKLVEIIEKLRSPNGCPWDRKQTHSSLRPHLLEETHEVLQAIASRNSSMLKEELGDLLLQIIFHAQLASEKKHFTINQVIQTTIDKMIRRHPHVFGQKKLYTTKEVLRNWEDIKQKEKKSSANSLLAKVPESLPALLRAHRVQAKAQRIGFSWKNSEQALTKLTEEVKELKQALKKKRKKQITEELGDTLFALVSLARLAKINPEDALNQTTKKFIQRFTYIEKSAKKNNRTLAKLSPAELLQLWKKSKTKKI